MLKFKFAIFLLLNVQIAVFSQFTPLYPYAYNSMVTGMEVVDDKIVILHHVAEYPDFGTDFSFEQVGGAFSSLFIYDLEGGFIKKLILPDSDSISHYAYYLKKLPDNRLILSGEVYRNGGFRYDPFIAIANLELNIFDTIFYYNPTLSQDQYVKNLVASDSDIVIYNENNTIQVFDYDFNLLRNFSFTNNCNVLPNLQGSSFYFNEAFYSLFLWQSQVEGSNISLLKYPELFSLCSLVFSESNNQSISDFTENNSIFFSKSGIKLNDSSFLVYGNFTNDIPVVYKVDSNEVVAPFFYDTSDTYQNLDLGFYSTIDYFNTNYIYFAFTTTLNQIEGALIYCLKENGDLRWKKFYKLENGLELASPQSMFDFVALPNKGLLLTIGVKGFQDASDVYILRVDSNGNAKDFITSISEVENQTLFSVYPNPTEGVLNLYSHYKNEATLSIFNSFGQILQTNKLTNNQNQIDVRHFSKGIYFYQINSLSNEILKSGKFMKQ